MGKINWDRILIFFDKTAIFFFFGDNPVCGICL